MRPHPLEPRRARLMLLAVLVLSMTLTACGGDAADDDSELAADTAQADDATDATDAPDAATPTDADTAADPTGEDAPAEPTVPAEPTEAEAEPEPEAAADASGECVITVEQAAELSGLPIQFVRGDQITDDIVECGYFEEEPENSAPAFRYEFRPGTLNDSNGPSIDPVAGLDARFKEATGALTIQYEEGVLLDLSGFVLGQEVLVQVAEAVLAATGG